MYLDALVVKIRERGHVRNKAIYVVMGVNMQGNKEVLGLWAGQAEGAKFWLQVLTELKNRGVADVFIACVDGLKGFPESIATVFPEAQVIETDVITLRGTAQSDLESQKILGHAESVVIDATPDRLVYSQNYRLDNQLVVAPQ
jgi:transposase-like protein